MVKYLTVGLFLWSLNTGNAIGLEVEVEDARTVGIKIGQETCRGVWQNKIKTKEEALDYVIESNTLNDIDLAKALSIVDSLEKNEDGQVTRVFIKSFQETIAGKCFEEFLSLPLGFASPVKPNLTAIVDDLPANVKHFPSEITICSIEVETQINIYGAGQNGWYLTDVCGSYGYIHQSQIRFK